MRLFLTRAVTLLSALFMAATASAQTQGLERVGPTSPSNGYPTWYQDKSGVALEFCSPINQAELDGGWCLLLTGDTVAPETFPTAFFGEHFYWAGDASITNGAFTAKLVLALEGAFANGAVINGDQITFVRIRVVFDAPTTGQYRVIHPFGVELLDGVAGQRVFFTEDVGILCGQNFDCALRGRVGPFLLPSLTPGGSELPAITGPVPGKLYIADPARLGPVTGSPFNTNTFRIEGPGGIVLGQTNDFTLQGRLFQGTMGGRVTVNKARYGRAAGNPQGKIDVFADAFSTALPRLPGTTAVGAVTPALGFYPAPCSVGAGGVLGAPAGVPAVQMFANGSRYYGQTFGAIPTAVCVQDSTARAPNGQTVPAFAQANVADQVTITQALFNPANGGSLAVTASSSDQNILPVLTASLGGVMTNAGGTASVTAANIVVPPLMVGVTSSAGGRAELEVSTLEGVLGGGNLPFAGNDAFTVLEDSPATAFDVLVNDTIGGAPVGTTPVIITITQAPALGVAIVSGGQISFTPTANAFGNDFLLYTISADGGVTQSAPGFVAITVTNVNDAPVAVNDVANGVGGLGISVPLLANDTDPDGAADLVGVNILSAPVGLVYTVVGGALSFTAPGGTYAFTYQARDVAGALSNIATVTVTLSGAETLAITRADYIANKRRWRIDGTSSVIAAQTVFVTYANGTFADGTSAVGFLVASGTVDPTGLFAIDLTLAGANDPRNPTSTLFRVRPTLIRAATTLGGSSPTTPIAVR
jgi:Bacterial Ig domain